MRGCLIVAGPIIVGIGLLVMGFVYDIAFAGIPFQDPTPALREQYASDAAIARGLELGGLVVLICGILAALVRRLRRSHASSAKGS